MNRFEFIEELDKFCEYELQALEPYVQRFRLFHEFKTMLLQWRRSLQGIINYLKELPTENFANQLNQSTYSQPKK